MIRKSGYNANIIGVIKDCLIIILLFVSFYFIDIQLASFISLVCTAIFLTRRIILNYNPGFVKGHCIQVNGTNVTVPEGVDIFDLSQVPSIAHLYNYVEIIRGILAPPVALIIRFCGIIMLNEYELEVLKETLQQLNKSKITAILSDVNENAWSQFRQSEIENEVGIENVFL